MKPIHCLALATAMLFGAPLPAQLVLYDNGRDPGNIYGWAISNGYWVTNSFTLPVSSTLTAVNVSVYDVNAYNLPLTLDWRILRNPRGEILASGSNATLRKIEGPDVNYFLFNQWFMRFDIIPALQLPPGTYWLELSNATNRWGTATFWGENNGPSKALFNGNVGGRWKHGGLDDGGSESFQILGTPQPNRSPLR